MLSRLEKLEMLKDARSVQRKESFRQTKVQDCEVAFDSYLTFLKSVQNIFSSELPHLQHFSNQNFNYFSDKCGFIHHHKDVE